MNKWDVETGLFEGNTVEVSAVIPIEEIVDVVMSQPIVFTETDARSNLLTPC